MDTKEQLVTTIKEWVKTDNEIRALQSEIKTRKDQQKKLSNNLMETMKKNEIDCFDIKNGQIMYVKKNQKKPITKKVLFDVLTKYFEGNYMKASELREYILENREDVIKETIVRKINKDIIDISKPTV